MHVVYVITRSDQFAGPQVHVRDLALALQRMNHRATVLVGGDGVYYSELKRQGIPSHSLRPLRASIRPDADLRCLVQIRQKLKQLGPDLVSTHSSKAGVLGRLAGHSLAIPTIHTAHGWSFTRQVPAATRTAYTAIERAAARWARHIITVSDFDRRMAIERAVAPPEQLTTVHNGVADVSPSLRARPGTNPPRLVTVARLEAQKDHATLLRALARLADWPWTLEVVGEGPLGGRLKQLARDLGLASRVRWVGQQLDVPRRLSASQLFLLVSNWEGLPRSILEAMRAGLPVIASDVGGVSEAVRHGSTGYLVPRGDAAAVEHRIRSLLSDSGRRVLMGAAGRRRYEACFDSDRFVNGTLEVYRELFRALAVD